MQKATYLLLLCTIVSSFAPSTHGESSTYHSSFLVPLTVSQIITLTGRYELEGVVPVTTGSPPQTVHVIFDTGSLEPLLYNVSCTDPDCGNAKKYDSSKSRTVQIDYKVGKKTLEYGAGNATGFIARDSIGFDVVQKERKLLFHVNESFLAIDSVHWRKSEAGLAKARKMAGILGMGPAYYNPFMGKLQKEYGIEMVSIRMPRGEPFTNGLVQFGGYDQLEPHFTGEPAWAGVTSTTLPYWVIYIQDVLSNGKSTGVCGGQACECMVDTGSGTMALNGARLPHIPIDLNCTDKKLFDNLPNITFVVANQSLTLEPRDYVLRLSNGTCQSTIFQNSDGPPRQSATGSARRSSSGLGAYFVIGIQWTSRITTIFDYKNSRIGFIQHD